MGLQGTCQMGEGACDWVGLCVLRVIYRLLAGNREGRVGVWRSTKLDWQFHQLTCS